MHMGSHSIGRSVIKTVSLPPDLADEAEERAKKLGHRTFSAYVQHLIRQNIIKGGAQILHEAPHSINSAKSRSEEQVLKLIKGKRKTRRK